jgi:putative transcriptional regulator
VICDDQKKRGVMENKIVGLRKDRGWTQQELAAHVAVSRQTIISLENGRYNPSLQLAFRLAHLFQTTIEDLFLYSTGEKL